jgi:hypothetical protein
MPAYHHVKTESRRTCLKGGTCKSRKPIVLEASWACSGAAHARRRAASGGRRGKRSAGEGEVRPVCASQQQHHLKKTFSRRASLHPDTLTFALNHHVRNLATILSRGNAVVLVLCCAHNSPYSRTTLFGLGIRQVRERASPTRDRKLPCTHILTVLVVPQSPHRLWPRQADCV